MSSGGLRLFTLVAVAIPIFGSVFAEASPRVRRTSAAFTTAPRNRSTSARGPFEAEIPAGRCIAYVPPVDGALAYRRAYRTPKKGVFKSCARWSTFGDARHRLHKGVDISAVTGTPVRAAMDGLVTYAQDPGGYGTFARVRFREPKSEANNVCAPGEIVDVLYAHLGDDPRALPPAHLVKAGEVIGHVGCSGNARGMCSPSPESHVHVTVERPLAHRRQVDPPTFLGWNVAMPNDSGDLPPGYEACAAK